MALTGKMRKWADAYLLTLSKTQASRLAGYGGSNSSLSQIGWENYRKLEVQAYMKDKLDEMAMTANEVLARLGMMASTSMADFATVKSAKELEVHEGAAAVKKFKSEIITDMLGRMHEKVELELYDAQAPLINIGKQHGLFSDHHIVETRVAGEVDALLDILKETLPSELYDNVLARLGGKGAGAAKAGTEQGAGGE